MLLLLLLLTPPGPVLRAASGPAALLKRVLYRVRIPPGPVVVPPALAVAMPWSSAAPAPAGAPSAASTGVWRGRHPARRRVAARARRMTILLLKSTKSFRKRHLRIKINESYTERKKQGNAREVCYPPVEKLG